MGQNCHSYGTSKVQLGLCFHMLFLPAPSQDLPNAMNAADITERLGLQTMRNRKWYIQATCATTGDGLYEGLDWLCATLKNSK